MLMEIAKYLGAITSIITGIAVICKPVRERLFGVASIKEGQKCLLRAEIVRIYYRNICDKTLREYEYTNMESCYAAYVALGGNSFVKRIHSEMQSWKII